MKQVININFQGRVIPIEVSAFELLKKYTDSLNHHFSNEEGKDEIINDIENRIGELFHERLKAGATCITDDDVNAVIKNIGRPEDFDEQETTADANAKTNTQKPTATTGTYKRLYRDENNKVLGGVCSGIANYFGMDPVIVRIITVIIFGVAFVPYLILWIAVPGAVAAEIGSPRKKLYRDTDDRLIAGICSGVANYFGINAWIVRVLFLLPLLSFLFHWHIFNLHRFVDISFSPGALMIYIILWLVVPEAKTTAEKLEMKGEKVDINSIKNSVMEEMKGVKQRAEQFGQDAKKFATDKNIGSDLGNAAKRTTRSLGDILVFIFKLLAYCIIGTVASVLVIVLLIIALASIGLLPTASNFLLRDGWQYALALGTLLFFISVPVIGIITWIIRRLAKAKRHGKMLRLTFISLWIVGWVCIVFLAASLTKDFKTLNTYNETPVALSNPAVNKLEITAPGTIPGDRHKDWIRVDPFPTIEGDTIFLRNVDVHILTATGDSFKVTMTKVVYGSDKHVADLEADATHFNIVQVDSLLELDKGIAISPKNKFRNQRIELNVYVPIGKTIRVDGNVNGSPNISFGWYNEGVNVDIDKEARGWKENVDYIMKADGLYTTDGKHVGFPNNNDDEDGITINTDDDSD